MKLEFDRTVADDYFEMSRDPIETTEGIPPGIIADLGL